MQTERFGRASRPLAVVTLFFRADSRCRFRRRLEQDLRGSMTRSSRFAPSHPIDPGSASLLASRLVGGLSSPSAPGFALPIEGSFASLRDLYSEA
jgi:hypothetical protein